MNRVIASSLKTYCSLKYEVQFVDKDHFDCCYLCHMKQNLKTKERTNTKSKESAKR